MKSKTENKTDRRTDEEVLSGNGIVSNHNTFGAWCYPSETADALRKKDAEIAKLKQLRAYNKWLLHGMLRTKLENTKNENKNLKKENAELTKQRDTILANGVELARKLEAANKESAELKEDNAGLFQRNKELFKRKGYDVLVRDKVRLTNEIAELRKAFRCMDCHEAKMAICIDCVAKRIIATGRAARKQGKFEANATLAGVLFRKEGKTEADVDVRRTEHNILCRRKRHQDTKKKEAKKP